MATRRGFLQGVAAGSVLVGCRGKKEDTGSEIVAGLREEEPEVWSPSGAEDRVMFPYGVRVGDVMADSAIIAIYTAEDVSSVNFEIQKAAGTSWVADQEGVIAVGDTGHGQQEITGLAADTAYAIVFYSSDGAKRSQVTRFRTAFDDETWRVITFGATSCLGGNLPWPNLTQAKNDKYDFFCLLGDTVYADADSFEGYWSFWDYVLRQDGLYDLFSSTSVIATWDDHEITNNFNWNEHPNQEKFDAALKAFRQGLPQRESAGGQIWRTLRYGKVLEVFVLDCRGERRGENYISEEQMSWLKQALSDSSSRFKIIMNSVSIVDFEPLLGNAERDDRWQGFPLQREEILSHIEDSAIEGVLWITGDFHYGSISRLSPAGKVGDSMYEVMTGPSGSFHNPMGNLLVPTEQYILSFAEWNHTRFVCNPDTGEVFVQFVGDEGQIIEEMSLMI